MSVPNEKDWVDLPKPLNCFTVRNASMVNLNTNKIIQTYPANTKIVVVQKYISKDNTYYRTATAAYHNLNYAFKASAFGLSNEKAPSVLSPQLKSLDKSNPKVPATLTHRPIAKQTSGQKIILPKGGEGERHRGWLRRIFRRKND